LWLGLLTQDMIDMYDPALMFTIPRLAIVRYAGVCAFCSRQKIGLLHATVVVCLTSCLMMCIQIRWLVQQGMKHDVFVASAV